MAATTYTNWRKSSRSGGDDNCVQVATAPDTVGVRDSKKPHGAILEFGRPAWEDFIAGAKAGEFDI
ncbi:DUF397 domain-containing protein [Phytohabitans aurantiacus]|uniref:DUF397 domain-containing protein n=1 Tax=Phytohabitans aurantiacus TaxID=3016789 RepID=A0ABQ5QZJ8_9ACTN|nr:DUF397 domain-containing protein [Phytohabitans aurantiacus]GLH99864.1 hypothetical protein Pa4123_51410 [Phytohabitans aurantiacus]